MPLIPQQAIIDSVGSTYALALERLEKQMSDFPDIRIVTISVSALIPGTVSVRIVAVVETV